MSRGTELEHAQKFPDAGHGGAAGVAAPALGAWARLSEGLVNLHRRVGAAGRGTARQVGHGAVADLEGTSPAIDRLLTDVEIVHDAGDGPAFGEHVEGLAPELGGIVGI